MSSDTDDTGSASRDAWEAENDQWGSDGDAARGTDGAQADGSDVDYRNSPGPGSDYDEDSGAI